MAAALLAVMLLAAAAAVFLAGAGREDGGQAAFAAARERGVLRVGVPHLNAPAEAGAKVRTPERLDAVWAGRLAQSLGMGLELRQVAAGSEDKALAEGEADVVLAVREAGGATPSGLAAVPLGHAARPKAVIRSDTALRRWQDVAGRSVCMAQAAVQAQALARAMGAEVRTFRVPSDALVAVREGACDLGVIDDAVWTPLMRFPEWKNFSSTLAEQGPGFETVWVLPGGDPAAASWLRGEMDRWRRDGLLDADAAKWARDVAFDVYLDQEVPDCHG